MKFVPNRDFDNIASTLNFSTPDLDVVGGCDLYITKAAGGDKKLYRNIENGLEAKHQSDVMYCQSLSPPQADLIAPGLNLSRSSPFGNLGQISSRRTYAYLIATLNASHPDYDFSRSLRPSDFKRERNLRAVMNNLDSTLYNLRPRPTTTAPIAVSQPLSPAAAGLTWGPRTWRLIDQQMQLKACAIYRYAPDDYDLFDEDDDGAIWSMNYFFFNKALKRVCYLHLRGISILSHQPSEGVRATADPIKRRAEDDSEDSLPATSGARKRARYWLGERADIELSTADDSEHEQELSMVGVAETCTKPTRPLVDDNDNYVLSDEECRSVRSGSKSTVRGVSEDIADAMEI